MMKNQPVTWGFTGGRYWVRTSDLFRVREVRVRGRGHDQASDLRFYPPASRTTPHDNARSWRTVGARPYRTLVLVGLAGCVSLLTGIGIAVTTWIVHDTFAAPAQSAPAALGVTALAGHLLVSLVITKLARTKTRPAIRRR